MIKNKHIIPLIALTAGLGACTTTQAYDETPYESRTASEGETVYEQSERIHKREKMHAQCKTDCTRWKQRAMQAEERANRLENQLELWEERNDRMESRLQNTYRK